MGVNASFVLRRVDNGELVGWYCDKCRAEWLRGSRLRVRSYPIGHRSARPG